MNYLENCFDMVHLIILKFDWNVNIATYSGNIRRPLFIYIVKDARVTTHEVIRSVIFQITTKQDV